MNTTYFAITKKKKEKKIYNYYLCILGELLGVLGSIGTGHLTVPYDETIKLLPCQECKTHFYYPLGVYNNKIK